MKTKIVIISVSVVLLVSLASNVYYLTLQTSAEQNRSLQRQVADVQSQLSDLNGQASALQHGKSSLETQAADLENQLPVLSNQTESLRAENAKLQQENADLENQLSNLPLSQTAPKLITRLGTTDVRSSPAPGHPWSGVTRFYISGEVWNFGTADACDCRLHVTLCQTAAVANDTYVELGTVQAGSFVEVDANIYYSGSPLTSWTIIPEYT